MIKQNILITGASSGVGFALAKYLSSRFNVIATARRHEKLMENFMDNDSIHPYFIDLSDRESLQLVIENIVKIHGDIYYLINNAGIMIENKIEDADFAQLDLSINVNAISPFILIQNLLLSMKKANFGRIINLTSGAPLNCFPSYGLYSSSKAVLNTLTVTLAKELSDTNIRLNLMSPGPVKSEMAPDGPMQPDVCFPTVDYLLTKDTSCPNGKFFWLGYEVPLFPDLEGVQWLLGKGNHKLKKIL